MRRITKRQLDGITALMECESVTEASKVVGVSRSTIHRWMAEPRFQQALREARSKVHGVALSRLCQLAGEAVACLAKGMRGDSITRTQYHCARSILEFAQGATAHDLEDRLGEIEDLVREATEGAV